MTGSANSLQWRLLTHYNDMFCWLTTMTCSANSLHYNDTFCWPTTMTHSADPLQWDILLTQYNGTFCWPTTMIHSSAPLPWHVLLTHYNNTLCWPDTRTCSADSLNLCFPHPCTMSHSADHVNLYGHLHISDIGRLLSEVLLSTALHLPCCVTVCDSPFYSTATSRCVLRRAAYQATAPQRRPCRWAGRGRQCGSATWGWACRTLQHDQ